MRLRRLAALAGVLTLTLVSAAPAAGAVGDANGPKCVDIVNGEAFYPSAGHVAAVVKVAAPTCRSVTYTLWVAPALADGTVTGDFFATTTGTVSVDDVGRGVITYEVTFSGSPEAICAYAETTLGRPVRDRGPDTGCDLVLMGTTPGRAGWS